MSLSKLAALALGLSLIGGTAYAQSDAGGGHGMMRGMFSQEERLVLFSDSQKATAGMSDDQRHAYREQQRDRFMSMSDADKAKMKADLDARWAALSPQQQADLKTKAEAFRAQHGWGQGGDHGGGGQ